MLGIGLTMHCAVIQQVLLLIAGSAAAFAPHGFKSMTSFCLQTSFDKEAFEKD
jgi:hypothetical protein